MSALTEKIARDGMLHVLYLDADPEIVVGVFTSNRRAAEAAAFIKDLNATTRLWGDRMRIQEMIPDDMDASAIARANIACIKRSAAR